MYTAIPFGLVANNAQEGRLIHIALRPTELVVPRMVAYIADLATAGSRTLTYAISRLKLHGSQPPTRNEMLDGGSVFFGVEELRRFESTAVGFNIWRNRVEVQVQGIQVAGDLIACVASGAGASVRVRVEFYYDIVQVGKVEKAMAIWRGESAEQPN